MSTINLDLTVDIFLIILSVICIITGFIGCILPILPGPPLSYLGLLLLHFTSRIQFSPTVLWVLGIMVLIVTVFDQVLPIVMTKKMGGTKYGVWGATIGLVVGLFFFGPVGAIVIPFIGALAGEMLAGVESKKAFKSAMGSFLGFIVGTGVKMIVCGIVAYYSFAELFRIYIIN